MTAIVGPQAGAQLLSTDDVVAARVRVVVIAQPADAGSFTSLAHRRSALALESLRTVYGERGPDYVEFVDRGGEAAVTVQARFARDPFLTTTRVGVRAWGTDEMLRILDGWLPDETETNLLHNLERTSLRHADVRLTPTAEVDATYAHFVTEADGLAAAWTLPPAIAAATAARAAAAPPRPALGARPLRLLFAAPLDPRRGPQALVDALLGLVRHTDAWQLTICGADRAAGGLATSIRDQLVLTAAGDPRIVFADAGSDLDQLLASHDMLVLPARWESWSAVGVHALLANRPLLATPVGGLHALAEPGVSGWLTADGSPRAIGQAVAAVLDDPQELTALIAAEGPRKHGRRVADERAVVDGYAELLAALPARRRVAPPRPRPPLVSVVIPYFRLSAFVERAIASAFAQTHPAIEVIVVDDGSGEPADAILPQLAERWPLTLLTQVNQGVGAARNLGIAQCAGRYVLPLDADNELCASFVERAVELLEAEPQLAYATSWSTFVDEAGVPLGDGHVGYSPPGGHGIEFDRRNIAGDAAALIRRRVFELGFRYRTDLVSLEDWMLYRELHDAGHDGAVIPAPLVSYRVRTTSKLRTMGIPHMERLEGELRARQRERSVEWT
ncbi:glycosyltransferase [Conexibacter sp. CPCC 206217]|uniref:glycosyltransferase n=1 Tax=Conexibacter sp. CPCC 206217 TaxID=3064574 RepID=UPI0027263381|nr:glycosyltransferase [Conexibacter sp. CPCC 206217]MDO8209999.1 glycosyltransferase [Conexibacter sp. CPCC 206217]